jgi:hypothetical protein
MPLNFQEINRNPFDKICIEKGLESQKKKMKLRIR